MDVIDTLEGLDPILQAFLAGLFTWFMTAAGAGVVFFFSEINRKVLDGMLGFAAGVMICLLYTSPSPRDKRQSRMPSSA